MIKRSSFVAWLLTFTITCFSANDLKSTLKFATVEKATGLLNTSDVYTDNWTAFDLESRLHKKNGTKEEQLKNFVSEIREWNESEKVKLNAAIQAADKDIRQNKFFLALPGEIHLVKTTMREEGGADGYTRLNCIVLGEETVKEMDGEKLKEIVLHEVFHVLSRNDSSFRRKMYGIIGFKLTNDIKLPPPLSTMKLSNPDAPRTDSYIELKRNGKAVDCAMILFSDREYSGGSFFDYVQIGLFKLKGDEKKEADTENGKAIIYSLDEVEGFVEQVGLNTEYLLDPEEIMAENFVLAIQNKKNQRSQWLIDKIQNYIR